jgi:hypothetical protein
MELSKLVILPTLLLTIMSCGGGGGESTSKAPEVKCVQTWQLDELEPNDEYHSETLIDSCTNSVVLFSSPDDTEEWDMSSANKRANILISESLLSVITDINIVWQVNSEGDFVRGTSNSDRVTHETQFRESKVIHLNDGVQTVVTAVRYRDSSGLSVMEYYQGIREVDKDGVPLLDENGDPLKMKVDLSCFYFTSQNMGECYTPSSSNRVALLWTGHWFDIREQFDRGVEVDSATTISLLINDLRTDL